MPLVDNKGVSIYWEEQGSGEPLLLIMGLSYSLDMWGRTRDVLARHYHVVLFDNRGVGRSAVPLPPYSIAKMASDAAAVLDAAGIGRAHVFGVSMGGLIAQEFTLQYPERVHSLVLGCTFCGGSEAVQASSEVLRLLQSGLTTSTEDGFRKLVPIIFHSSTAPETIAELLALRLRFPTTPKGFLGQAMAIGGYRSCGRLAQIAAPVLVIHGDSDLLVPYANARVLAERIPGAKLETIPSAGHIFLAEKPEQSHAAILEFLAAHPMPERLLQL